MKVALLAQEIIKVPVLDFGFLIFRGLLRFYDHAMCHFLCFIVVDHNWQRMGLTGSVYGMAHSLLVHLPKYFEILQVMRINFSVTWSTGIFSTELDFNALFYMNLTPLPLNKLPLWWMLISENKPWWLFNFFNMYNTINIWYMNVICGQY